MKVKPKLYAEMELDLMSSAWTNDTPLASHDGRWGKATTELCLALIQSEKEHKEISLAHQVAVS